MTVILSILAFIAIAALSCLEDFGISFIIGVIACLLFFSGFSELKEYVTNHNTDLLFAGLIYLTVGVIWSFFKWGKYISENYGYEITKKAKDENTSKAEAFDNLRKKSTYSYRMSPTKNVNKIMAWIVAWPFSMLCYALFDLLHDLVHSLVKLLSEVYNKSALSFINLFFKED